MSDHSQDPRELEVALSVCRDALCRSLETEVRLESMREPLRTLCVCARRERVPPERMLVVLKQLLHDVAPYGALSPQARDTLRGRLVEMAIDAYYADDLTA